MKASIRNIFIILLAAVWCASCSNTKHLPAGDSLFTGSVIGIQDKKESTRKEREVIVEDLKGAVRPKPNREILGMRVKLRLYTFAGVPKKEKGFKSWLRNKIGEPPVLTSSYNQQTNVAIMENLLQNRGFFHARVRATTRTDKKRRTKAIFFVRTGEQYHIRNVQFLNDSTVLSNDIARSFRRTLLKPKSSYNLDVIKAERARIERRLQRKGYYFFTQDYVLVQVDSNLGTNEVDLYVKLKTDQMPANAFKVQHINDVYVFPGYRLSRTRQADTSTAAAVEFRNVKIVDRKKAYKPFIFSDAILFKKGDRYDAQNQDASLSRLVNMGLFKFVKNRFESASDSTLNVYYYLTPFPKKSIQFQIGALTQNDNRAGSNASISWKNRNTFKGGEEFLIKLNGGFEAQYGGAVNTPNIYTLGAEATMSIPRFVVPFLNIHTNSMFIPRTLIKAGYSYESQSNLLRIKSYKASYGYSWKESVNKEHQFYPINITYVKTDTLGDPGQLGLLYGNLLFDGIIIGPTYQFTYNSQMGRRQRTNTFFFSGLIDLSGNMLGIAQKADYETNPKTIFGSTYAQYVKLMPDLRHYLRFNKSMTLASRFVAGVGIPYGNSKQLPNVKQFWAGGNSDMRGFQSRLLGPGTFNEFAQNGTRQYIQTLGDIKLEFNTELRYNVYKFFNAAAFFDAGNIWLYRDNPDFPGGKFTSSFYKEYAANVGLGFRFDFSILILRLDLGMPVRKPWLPEGERWTFNDIRFGDPTWRKENLILNIGIGYPF